MCYEETQLLCPNCDPKIYGLLMNKDFFPHIISENTEEIYK